jgi:hypothetical protein
VGTATRAAASAAFAGAFIVCSAAASAPTMTALALTDAATGETLAITPIEEGEEFEIRYVHSFEGTEIHETYVAEGEEIVQVREAYEYHAAGLDGTRETDREGDMSVAEFEQELGSFSVRVAGATEQELVVGGETRPLRSYADAGSTITVEVKRVSYAEYRVRDARTGWQQ